MKIQPLVTVYIPTYNRLKLLKRAIGSVLTQSYPNIELIVVDDSSNDGTKQFMEKLCRDSANVIFLENESNQGACVSRNKAINIAKGEFITGLDDDDYFLPDRINNFINAWPTKKNDTVFLFSNRVVQSTNGNENTTAPKTITKEMIFLRNYIGNQGFAQTTTIKKIRGFDNKLPAWQDFDFFLSLLTLGKAQCLTEATYIVDISHESSRISNIHYSKILQAFDYIVNKHRPNKKQQRRLQLQLLNYQYSHKKALRLACEFIAHGDIAALWACGKKIIRLGILK